MQTFEKELAELINKHGIECKVALWREDYNACKDFLERLQNTPISEITLGELSEVFWMAHTHLNILRKRMEAGDE
jgi:hypothetical protein